jgi:hypothetical protein
MTRPETFSKANTYWREKQTRPVDGVSRLIGPITAYLALYSIRAELGLYTRNNS